MRGGRPGALLVYQFRLGPQMLAILLLKASTESQVVVPDGGTPFGTDDNPLDESITCDLDHTFLARQVHFASSCHAPIMWRRLRTATS